MRAPNALIFVITAPLAFVGACEYVGIPFSIPDIKLPLVGCTTAAIPPFLASHAFWLMFAAWFLLAIAALLPRRAAHRSEASHAASSSPAAGHHVGEPQPAA
jgi:hypothetical protein